MPEYNERDWNARLAVVEHRLNNLDMKIDGINTKLEDLLQLKSKGMGAFWLASLVVGTGIFGFFMTMLDWMKS